MVENKNHLQVVQRHIVQTLSTEKAKLEGRKSCLKLNDMLLFPNMAKSLLFFNLIGLALMLARIARVTCSNLLL